MYTYQKPESSMTVRDGLKEFRAVTGIAEKMNSVRPAAAKLMDRHDIVHVVFGLDTSLRQEAIVDIWTLLGTTASLSDVLEYVRLPEEQAILAEIGCWKVTATTVRAIPDVGRVLWAARKLKQKWPWAEHEDWLDRPLDQVREELGVTLLAA